MVSVAVLPMEIRSDVFYFLNTSSRFAAIAAHSTMFVEGSSHNATVKIHNMIQHIKQVQHYLKETPLQYPLMEDVATADFNFATEQWEEENLLRDAPTCWGLSRSDQDGELSIVDWMTYYGQRFKCPFQGWLTINGFDRSLSLAVDMLLSMNGSMRYFPDKVAVVITFRDPDTGIEGSCFASGPFIDSDDSESAAVSDFDSDGPL